MIEYGYINEDGYLRSKVLEVFTERYKDENEETKERTVSIEEQAALLASQGWKPVDVVDEDKLICSENYSVSIIPYDAGKQISYRYELNFDLRQVERKICGLKNSLTSNDSEIGDYRITKCYEASLIGLDMPYNVADLHAARQAVRDKINQLEELIALNT